MSARSIACILLCAAALAGCGASPDTRVALATANNDPAARVARHDRPPVALLDCDGDKLVSLAELSAGFQLHQRAVSAEEFAGADLSRDGRWNEAEFSRFLDHRAVRSWSVFQPCPLKAAG